MRRYVSMTVLMFASVFPAAAAAQDEGKVAVMMAAPGSIGVVWPVSDRISVRPEGWLNWTGNENDVAESTSFQFTAGASVLFYTGRWDNLATYIAPRYTFTRTSVEIEGIEDRNETSSRVHRFVGSFGAEYGLGERFDVFGEFGLGYERASGGSEPGGSRGWILGTRTQIGVVFHF